MIDPRISTCTAAARAMAAGDLHPEIPTQGSDSVAELGRALEGLGSVLEHRFQELDRLVTVTSRVNTGVVLVEVLDYVYETFQDLIPYHRIGFALLEDDGRVLRAHWARAEAGEVHLGPGYAAPMAGSSLERILETGEPRVLNDLEAHLEARPGSDSTRRMVQEGIRSSLTCPLVSFRGPLGFMFFSSRHKGTYARAHVGIFQQLAGQLAVILEKSRLHDQLRDLNAQKDRFMGMAAHDLRNPAMIIQGFARALREGALGSLTAEQVEVIEDMEREAGSIHELVSSLLDVHTIEAGRLVLESLPGDLGDLVRARVRANDVVARGKHIALEVSLPGRVPQVPFDRRRLGQVLDNLITNALKYSAPGTRVRVTLEVDAGAVRIAVQDQGQGIPAGELEGLFHEFGRTSVRPTGGESSTGLGLAIARRIVEAHGGSLGVTSAPGQGSTFSLRLPAGG